ncbi:MAG: M1 family metallopeptidase, partial [Patescibacteria group bacterium]
MKWWDDLWLNESFATFMAYKVLNNYWPEWDIWTQYLTMTVFDGMYLDSLKSSHPIKVKVTSIEEMNELFDEIAYDKGGSVLRMIERFMGEEAFKSGLRTYMKKFEYQNTEAKDLWKALDEKNKEDIEPLVEKFVTQIGFPYVTVEKDKLVQNRFLNDTDTQHKEEWDIPLVVQYNSQKEKNIVMKGKTMPFTETGDLQTINGDYGGFFITKYSDELLKKVSASYINITTREKIGFIHDLYYLVKFRKSSLKTLLNFYQTNLIKEQDSAVLFYAVEVLESIHQLIESSETEQILHSLAKHSVEVVGLEAELSEDSYSTFLRASALSYLSEIKDETIAEFLNNKFKNYLDNPVLLHPDLHQITFSNAVISSDINYEKMKELYLKSTVQEEKVKFLNALGKTQNKKLLIKTLDFSLSPEVKFANVMYAVNSVSNNPVGKEIALDWIINQWDEFGKRVGGHGGVLLRRLVKIVMPVCGVGHEDKVKKFIEKNKIIGLEKTFEQIWEELQINSEFVKLNNVD